MSSPPSSSGSPTATAPTITTVRCRLAGILRRILCSRSLPTHPADHTTESSSVTTFDNPRHDQLVKCEGNFVRPGAVAKLMGLDSVPDVNAITSATAPSSIARVRSMNSIDYCPDRLKGERRRVSRTQSLRDMSTPTFFEHEDGDFFILSFENRIEKEGKERKCEKGIAEIHKQDSDRGAMSRKKKRRKKKKKVQNVELECSSSEESSPVSVLGFDQFIIDHEVLTSDSGESNSRRQLSPQPQNYECQSQPDNDNTMTTVVNDVKTRKAEGKCVGSRNKVCCSNRSYLCDQLCKIAEGEILEANWLHRRNIFKHEDFEDVYADFESQILDQLLLELVHELHL